MKNFLSNGTVLPHGLLGCNFNDFSRGFNKTYKNTALRVGMISNIYNITDAGNISKLTTEYDVIAIQQDEDKGIASITYKNCFATDGLGSIPDYFEKNFRAQTQTNSQNQPIDFKGQNGAIVFLLCLDALSEKAIIIGGLNHPNRPTTLLTDAPHLQGEYNGMQVIVNSDGSAALNFQGATDNNGNVINSQGITSITIAVDGSFQIMHSAVTLSLAKSGTVSLKATQDLDMAITGNVNITCNGNMTIDAKGKVDVIAKEIDLNGTLSGITTFNSHEGVIDLITGVPVQPSTTTFGDV